MYVSVCSVCSVCFHDDSGEVGKTDFKFLNKVLLISIWSSGIATNKISIQKHNTLWLPVDFGVVSLDTSKFLSLDVVFSVACVLLTVPSGCCPYLLSFVELSSGRDDVSCFEGWRLDEWVLLMLLPYFEPHQNSLSEGAFLSSRLRGGSCLNLLKYLQVIKCIEACRHWTKHVHFVSKTNAQ